MTFSGMANSMILSADGSTLYFGYDAGIAQLGTVVLRQFSPAPVSYVPTPFTSPAANARVLGIAPDNSALYYANPISSPPALATDNIYSLPQNFQTSAANSLTYAKAPFGSNSYPVIPTAAIVTKAQNTYVSFTDLTMPSTILSAPSPFVLSGAIVGFPTTTGTEASAIPVGLNPIRLTYASTTSLIYALNQSSQTISVIDATKNVVNLTITLPAASEATSNPPDTNNIATRYVDMVSDSAVTTLYALQAGSSGHAVEVIDTVSAAVFDEIPSSPSYPIPGIGLVVSGGTLVRGSSQLSVGDELVVGCQSRNVVAVNNEDTFSGTSVTIDSPFVPDLNGNAYTINRPASIPTALAVVNSTSGSLKLTSYQFILSTKKTGHDAISFEGTIPLDAGTPLPATVSVNIGGYLEYIPSHASE